MAAVIRRSREDRIFDLFNVTVMTVVLLAVLYPLYFIVIASVSDPDLVGAGRVWFWPRGLTAEGYQRIFNDDSILVGYRNSLIYMTVGTGINLALTLTGAYALSRKDMLGRNLFMMLLAFTMFFHGGLIPRYLLVKNLGLLNSLWAMVLPNAVVMWNLIVARTFFQTNIPDELLEAAQMDGCSNMRFFAQVVLPLSQAIVAVMLLFYGVMHWNAFFDALIFLRSRELYPLQIVLRDILIQAEVMSQMLEDLDTVAEQQRIAEIIKYGVIIVASLPVLILYPLIQKYFVQGVMIGAIKG